jgi:hypothetical protein
MEARLFHHNAPTEWQEEANSPLPKFFQEARKICQA